MSKYRELHDLILNGGNIVLVGHVNPDGDCIGALTGFYHFLKEKKQNVNIIVPNKYASFLNILDTDNIIKIFDSDKEEGKHLITNADVIACMDFNSFKRIDELGVLVENTSCPKVLIDHHPGPDKSLFKVAISDSNLSSTCEVVYTIIKHWKKDKIGWELNLNAANSLYTGLVTDTNNFSNSVLPSTFEMAGDLLKIGVDKEAIQTMIYGGYSEGRMRLMGYMLYENMKIYSSENASVMILTKAAKEKFNFTEGDSEGFVNLALGIKEVEVSVLFTEADDFVRVSLRSKGDFSVNKLSRAYFNGGGHERAAGGRLFMPLNEVESYFLKCLKEFKENRA